MNFLLVTSHKNVLYQIIPDIHPRGRAGHQLSGGEPRGHLRRVLEPVARRAEYLPRLPLRPEEALLYLPVSGYGKYLIREWLY